MDDNGSKITLHFQEPILIKHHKFKKYPDVHSTINKIIKNLILI